MTATTHGASRPSRPQRAAAAVTALLTMFASLLAITLASAPPASAASDSLGTDYWVAFMQNYSGTPELTLFITGPTATTGTVEIPGLSFSQTFSVTPGTVTSVPLPAEAQIVSSDVVENLGVHVTAAAEVSVYGLNRIQFTTDAFLGLPTDILGGEYLMLGYEGTTTDELAVVGTQNTTTVTIVPRVAVGAHAAGVPFTVAVNQGQTYQLAGAGTGTIVTADKPVAVFGGNNCADVPPTATACDHLVEEMTPTVAWGKSFVTEPLATRLNGDTFRYLASADATTVSVNGAVVATLNRGEFFEQILTTASTITSNKPILVAQYSNGSSFDGVTSDPFEVLVPPYEQFLNSYTVTTPAAGFTTNFINVVAPNASVGTVTLDGSPIPAASFTAIPGSSFSGAQLSVALGSHRLSGPQPFGITVYGFADFDSYGYPGGLSLAPVATVTNLDLTPATSTGPVNSQHCVTATVTDQNNAAVSGVRVDFTVTGVNPTSGFANTAANGTAPFCYTGTTQGTDSIQAAVGTVSHTASRTWTPVGPTTHTLGVTVTGTGSVASNPAGITCPSTCSAPFADASTVTLTPTPASGFAFAGWSGACTGTAGCSITMSADQSVTATFTAVPVTHTLSVAVTGSGSVGSNPAGITCPGTCSAPFAEGSTVALTPTPASGFAFAGWSGACTGTGGCSITMSADKSVTAAFTAIPVTHSLGVGVNGSGSVVSTPAGINCPGTCAAAFADGTSVTLTPTPAAGFVFSNWGGNCNGNSGCTVTMNAERLVAATFTPVTVTHSLGVGVNGSGSVVSTPAGINCPGTCAAAFADGTSVTLTPTPAAGFVFSGWAGNCTGNGGCTLTMNAERLVAATFSPVATGTVTVTETSDPPTVTAGQHVRQTFTVTNSSNAAVTGVVLNVAFPAGSSVVSSNPSQGSCTAGPATLTCTLDTIPAGGSVTVPVVVAVPANFSPGVFAPTATTTSDQTATTPAGPLPGSNVVAPTGGQAVGFVEPGGTITTGDASTQFPTAASFTLPNTGAGSAISLTTTLATPTYCGGQPCRGRLLTLSPFTGGYDDPKRPPVLDISLDSSIVRRFGPAFQVWVQKENTTTPPQLVPDCRSLRSHGEYRWHHEWWEFHEGQKIAVPSPCVSKRYIDRHGDSHTVILVLQGDPKFGRR